MCVSVCGVVGMGGRVVDVQNKNNVSSVSHSLHGKKTNPHSKNSRF